MSRDQPILARLWWVVLGYTVLVIVFGAWVRITGSGAGCGQHWPSCNGEVLHRPESVETLIELSHRLTSGVLGLLTLAAAVVSWARTSKGAPVRRFALLSVVFIVTEALVGAFLVKAELVADNASASRAVVMSLHLVNTCLLTTSMTLAAWTSTRRQRPVLSGSIAWIGAAVLALVLLVAMSGSVTALGDTLFPLNPDGTVAQHLLEDQSPTAGLLQRARVVHPILAVIGALVLLYGILAISDRAPPANRMAVRGHARIAIALVAAQVIAGAANIFLSAPGYLQLIHLGLFTVLWVELIVLLAAALTPHQSSRN